METNPLSKLVELDKKLTILEERGEAIREPFNALMKRQHQCLSFLLSIEDVENDPDLDPETIKERIKKHKSFIKFYSMKLSTLDRSIEIKKINYQKIRMSEILVSKNNRKTIIILDQKYGIKEIISSMEGLIKIQTGIVSMLEEIVEAEYDTSTGPNPKLFMLN